MAATYDGDGNRATQSSLYHAERQLNADASGLGSLPRGLSTTEEVFDVVGYVNSTLSGTAQVMTSFSTKSGTTNEVYGMTRLATTTESHTSYFVNDGRGSVVQTTNAQGVATSWKSYSAFGEIEASSTLGELPTYGYNAEEQHPKTGLSFMRFRYYEAKTSTFGVQDTYLGNIFSPLTLNRYLYCLGNPVNYVDPTGHKGIGNILLNAANRVINPKKKHGGTQINNNSFADDPDQKTIYKPAWEAYDPSLTPDQRHQRSVANATLNEMLWHYELAMNSGNAAAIAYHLDCARKIQAEYEAFYCGDAENVNRFDLPNNDFYKGLKAFSDNYWFIPVLSGMTSIGASSMEGNIPLTIFNVLLTGVEILGIGEGVKSAIKLRSASVKAYKIAKYGEVIYENTKQNRVVRSFPKLGFKIKDTTVMNSEQAAELISNAERKGTALKKHDLYHEQAGHLTKEELEQGKMFILSSKSGEKILFQVKGKLGDKEGIYEYLLEKDGKVSHQMFVKKKEIDGHFGYDR